MRAGIYGAHRKFLDWSAGLVKSDSLARTSRVSGIRILPQKHPQVAQKKLPTNHFVDSLTGTGFTAPK
jgi:hypothetical protein